MENSRPLAGYSIGLSLSDSDESGRLGFPANELSRSVIRTIVALVGHGARIVLGHDWRDDGVMEAVFSYVERYRPRRGEAAHDTVIRSFLAWPDRPRLREDELAVVSSSLSVERLSLPPELERYSGDTGARAFIRAVALSLLRGKLTQEADARVCLGGRMAGYQGFLPGVIEEAFLAAREKKPLYLLGMLGGATSRVIAAARKELPKGEFLFELPDAIARSRPDFMKGFERPEKLANLVLQTISVDSLASANGLSAGENEQLFDAKTLDEALELVLTGLIRLRR